MTFDPRVRPLLLVLVLVVAAAGAGLMVISRMQKSHDGSAKQSSAPSASARPAPRHVARPRAVPPQQTPKPATATTSDQLPVAIQRALAASRVVVVALYDPNAKIDGTALAEAKAGAERAGSAFVPVDVRKRGVDSLNAKYGVIQDPAVLVLRPPGTLVVRIDGFADRDTVAQAAVNAAS